MKEPWGCTVFPLTKGQKCTLQKATRRSMQLYTHFFAPGIIRVYDYLSVGFVLSAGWIKSVLPELGFICRQSRRGRLR